ncbi:MAG: DUF1629 domain-containing protein [Hellea sp.]
MAYIIRGAYNKNQYSDFIQLTPESKAENDEDLRFFQEEIVKTPISRLPYVMGLRYPKPSSVYRMTCPVPENKFHNFMYSDCGILVSQTIVDLIEEFEPGVHQFFLVELLMTDDQTPPQPYYILNVCTYVQSLDLDKSDVYVRRLPEERHKLFAYKFSAVPEKASQNLKEPYRYFVSKEKIEGRAIWGEYGFDLGSTPFISEAFHDRVQEIGGFGACDIWQRTGEL